MGTLTTNLSRASSDLDGLCIGCCHKFIKLGIIRLQSFLSVVVTTAWCCLIGSRQSLNNLPQSCSLWSIAPTGHRCPFSSFMGPVIVFLWNRRDLGGKNPDSKPRTFQGLYEETRRPHNLHCRKPPRFCQTRLDSKSESLSNSSKRSVASIFETLLWLPPPQTVG